MGEEKAIFVPFFSCSSDQSVTHLHPSVQADLSARHKEEQRLSFLLQCMLHRCIAEARSPDTAHLLTGSLPALLHVPLPSVLMLGIQPARGGGRR